jgi:methionine-rich copper-binding protein CopC
MKKMFSILMAVFLVIGCAPSASAHAQLTSSNPGVNKTIKSTGEFIWVEFDGDLMVFGNKNPNVIFVTDSKKNRVDAGGSIVGGARLSTRLKESTWCLIEWFPKMVTQFRAAFRSPSSLNSS